MDRKKKMPFRNRHPNFPLYLSVIAACGMLLGGCAGANPEMT